jgi:LmbE family N-acetylglucosaminyl deacetylase
MKVVFMFAHPDDEAFGPAGTIMMHVANGDEVTVISLCNGNRPGANVQDKRADAFIQNCENMGVDWKLFDQPDTLMTREVTQQVVNTMIDHYRPNIVYTHFNGDVHQDHRLLSECVLVACRPKPESSVTKLLMCELPASTEWAFGQYGTFSPNVFIDVSRYINEKENLLRMYGTETYEYPDARSVESMRILAAQRGKQSGVSFAEAFQLVFSLSRKSS